MSGYSSQEYGALMHLACISSVFSMLCLSRFSQSGVLTVADANGREQSSLSDPSGHGGTDTLALGRDMRPS